MNDERRLSVSQQQFIASGSFTGSNNGGNEGLSRASSLSSTSSQRRSLSSCSGIRGRRAHAGTRRLTSSGKGYSAHVPVFSNYKDPTTIVLEPFPNRRIRSMCVAGGALVTAHRNGIRVYRQRYITAAQATNTVRSSANVRNKERVSACNDITDIRTGIWEIVESRDNFQFRDAYLCVGVEPVFNRERFLPLKWNRYLAVASGADRTHYSVCVLSTAAHFILHHELHGKNKIVALNFALVALESRADTRRYKPFVVSVDEIGEVVLFDVEQDHAVKLLASSAVLEVATAETVNEEGNKGSLLFSTTNNNKNNKIACDDDRSSGVGGVRGLGGACGEEFLASTNNMISDQLHNGFSSTATLSSVYSFDAGLAFDVRLVGPCQVYCRGCSDVPFVPGSLMLSLYIASHANCADGQAELQVTQLCVRWTFFPPCAMVIGENNIVREGAPEEVCNVGIAMLRVPFYDGLPQRFIIGRPRLRFWSISGCSGRLLQLHRVYNDMDGSGKGARTVKEHFVRVVPLGRYVLAQDSTTSWLCVAALTDDDVILLLGTEPLHAGFDTIGSCSQALSLSETEPVLEVTEKQKLDEWLDDVEDQRHMGQLNVEGQVDDEVGEKEKKKEEGKQLGKEDDSFRDTTVFMTPPMTFMDPNKDYTVLMVLTAPGFFHAPPNVTLDKSPSNSRILVFLPQSNELLFFIGGTEKIYSVKLPFDWLVASDAEQENQKKKEEVEAKKTWGNLLRGEPVGWIESAFNGGLSLDLKIARPLMSAVLGLAGEVEVDKSTLPPLKASLHQSEEQQKRIFVEDMDSTHDDNSASFGTLVSTCVDVKDSSSRSARKKKRRSTFVSVMGADEQAVISSVIHNRDGSNSTHSCTDAQEAYIDAEREKILGSSALFNAKNIQKLDLCIKDAVTLTEIITRNEPMQRDAITYEWSDLHDAFYVQFINEMQEFVEKERNKHAASDDSFLLCWSYQQRLHERFVLNDLNNCFHSAGFMRAFREAQVKRFEVSDKGGIFDFASYFAGNVVPQRVLDLQEDDRCRFELADLRVAFEEDIRKLNEVETVVIYENEERRVDINNRRRWMPHQTFPFDDESGGVVDLTLLNLTAALPGSTETVTSVTAAAAGMLSPSLPSRWRWENDGSGGGAPRLGGSKMLRKELQSWNVGEWMYAERWPTRQEEVDGSFKWSTKADVVTTNVRRRRLTRNRINIAVEAAKLARREEYEKKLEQLRLLLGI